ncbi:hypothetical protein Cgig2_011772 [Carnegiea gigantea]|uniref:Uncharacterized protein n=1 Tax=Carnegiea gigantea TaxID=171969 RepID=A0A9Q1Q6Z4_9CARY|nr:hypothetical protein Cgig2_011772 [Carnegiea gigantea]
MLGLFPESGLKNSISVQPHPRLKGAPKELGKGRLYYTECPPIQNPQPLDFVKNHCAEDDLGQFQKFEAASSLLSPSEFIARAQGLKIIWERQQGKSNPAPTPLEVGQSSKVEVGYTEVVIEHVSCLGEDGRERLNNARTTRNEEARQSKTIERTAIILNIQEVVDPPNLQQVEPQPRRENEINGHISEMNGLEFR